MADDSLARTYLKTLVEIEENGLMVDAGRARMLQHGPAHVITAWNPGDVRPNADENAAADERLRVRLRGLGHEPVRAIGSDPDSPHYEQSWAVLGLTDADARTLGAEFGQVAVFRLELGKQTVLGCFDDWEVSRDL